ncbi:aminopeptidase P family protein [Alkalibaculum bacchi]|nr:aminopeptidase P family protein [Alkalibaculum bacchi]
MKVKDWIETLRRSMKENSIDAYIVPSYDAHQSEYVADYFKARQWLSGFTGSAGTVVITLDDAGLWTDGRYYTQAANQLLDSGIRLFRMVDPGVPSYTEWLRDTLKEGSVIGFDGKVLSINTMKNMEKILSLKNISLKIDIDLIDTLWKNRPSLPDDLIFTHDIKFAGQSRVQKLDQVRKKMKEKKANYYLLSSLDDIAWLLNIRGSDVPNNPVVISYVVVEENKCTLFINLSKVSADVEKELEKDQVLCLEYNHIHNFLHKLTPNDAVLLDPLKTSSVLYYDIPNHTTKIESLNITTKLKAIKNNTELSNLRTCEINDGVAMVKFIKWLKSSVESEVITEISASEKLESFRAEQEFFVSPSFDTIAGYKDHAAMMHYSAKEDTQYTLKNEGFFLVDSGGQYYNGTTDITRTIVLGLLTKEEKRDFTLVLKGHIALSSAKFLHGATGSNLDVLARGPIWEVGLDYKCGTGHGVGFFLNVHEGPQSLSKTPNKIILEKGMILTNEPGIYNEGKYGIRTENMMIVVEDEETEYGAFLKFEPITYCPIDLDGIDMNLLTDFEIEWINDYHREVFSKLSPHLNPDEAAWLEKETRKI